MRARVLARGVSLALSGDAKPRPSGKLELSESRAPRGVIGLAGASFYLSGALVAVLVALLGSTGSSARTVMVALAISAALAGVGVFVLRWRLPGWSYHPMNIVGTTMVTLLVLVAPGRPAASALAVLYVYVPLDSFFFFPADQALIYQAFGYACIAVVATTGAASLSACIAVAVVSTVLAGVVAWLVHDAARAGLDPLTRLANRAALERRLSDAMAVARVSGAPLALAVFNLDHFDAFNNSQGRDAGDAILRRAAARLREAAPGGTVMARASGDGFALLLPGMDAATALPVAEHVRAQLSDGYPCSAGVADMGRQDTMSTLLHRSRAALHEAKGAGRERTAMQATNDAEVTALEAAIAGGELFVMYQPVISLSDARVIGAEALVRWQRPGYGLVEPEHFVALAEEHGLIVELGAMVLRSAATEAASWPEWAKVNVNASGAELDQRGYAERVREVLAESGLAASKLVIEVTETCVGQSGSQLLANLEDLRAMGVRVALDDFGTGYSSLYRFSHLPIDFVKVDRSFVLDVNPDGEGATIISAICALAKATGRTVIAEGVERPYQAELLHSLGADEAQGYLYGRPGPASILGLGCATAKAPDLSRRGDLTERFATDSAI